MLHNVSATNIKCAAGTQQMQNAQILHQYFIPYITTNQFSLVARPVSWSLVYKAIVNYSEELVT